MDVTWNMGGRGGNQPEPFLILKTKHVWGVFQGFGCAQPSRGHIQEVGSAYKFTVAHGLSTSKLLKIIQAQRLDPQDPTDETFGLLAFSPFFDSPEKSPKKNKESTKKSLKSSVLKALERLLLHHQQLISRLDSRLHGPSLALHATHQNLGRWWPQFQRQTQIFHLC